MKSLGSKIRSLRQSLYLTQENIAHELNLSLPAYSKIERDITDVSLSRLKQLADFFKIPLTELLDFDQSTINNKELSEKNKTEDDLRKLIEVKNQEIIELQKKVIKLLEDKS